MQDLIETGLSEEVKPPPDHPRKNPLIGRLISDREASDTAATRTQLEKFDDIQTAHRNLDPLRTDEIYLFGISVNIGVGRLTIDCGEIEINPELSEAIASANGRFTITLPIFKDLLKKGSKLATRRRKIQKFLRFANPYWYVSKKDLVAVRDEIFKTVESDRDQDKGMLQLLNELKAEAMAGYDNAFADFLSELEAVLLKASPFSRDRIDELLERYAEQFPTRQEVLENFNVVLEGPIKIPSLVEEATRNADLAEQLEREEQAQLKRMKTEQAVNVQVKEQAAIAELQAYWIKSVQESFAVGIRNAQDDAYGLIADLLSAIEQVDDPARVNGNLKKRLDGKLRDLETAVNQVASVNEGGLDTSLQSFAEQVRQLKVLTTSAVAPERLQERLEDLRSRMTEELEQVFTSDKRGHKALAKWLIYEEETDVTL
ncbi:MAG: hypothetical protein KME11_04865 [Timaviella obliquedivisa GSE-PSE-MK23-08B]|jgi:hypothetical protein|nr:hypothetical protein [Timaviella obliquedivisa GSE-PSE-MK23-08B]